MHRFISPRPSAVRRLFFATAALGAGLTLNVDHAGAAFPGENGRIVFESLRSGRSVVYTMRPDGTDVNRLTTFADDSYQPDCPHEEGPSWSADGKRVVLSLYRCDDGPTYYDNSDLYVVNADGTGRTNLTLDREYEHSPVWSPDGEQIAYAVHDTLRVRNIDGTNVKTVWTYAGADPAWSPDGRRIAFSSYREGFDAVWVMNADGTNPKALTTKSLDAGEPDWSPDGRQIAFTGVGGRGSGIYLMNADGTGIRPFFTPSGLAAFRPAWSPDAQKLMFTGRQSGSGDTDVYVINVNGTGLTNLTKSPDDSDVGGDWQPLRTATPDSQCTVKGTAGDDVLHGTAGDDVICGFAGDDIIYGHGGNDRLYGGKNNDTLHGAGGNDIIVGGRGADRLAGEGGRDHLDATDHTSGNDNLDGGSGTNTCSADVGDAQTRC